MANLLYILFFGCLLALMHSYLFFPWQMFIRAKRQPNYPPLSHKPTVAVLLAAYNEADVIAKKIKTTLETRYPHHLLEMWVGSDCSTDGTDEIVKKLQEEHKNLHLVRMENRTGKPQIINQLREKAQAEILILTDADTFFNPDTIEELLKPFGQQRVGAVQGNIVSEIARTTDITAQEVAFNSREMRVKAGEATHGAVMGAHGAICAVRNRLYKPTPQGFITDDFYLFLTQIEQGYEIAFAPDALATMPVDGEAKVQFNRKVRISVGNFQSLLRFKHLLLPKHGFVAYAFFSHKVLRWFGPFFLLAMFYLHYWLHVIFGAWLSLTFYLHVALYALALLDRMFPVLPFGPLRYWRHFLEMNLALLMGFFKFLRGSQSSAWNN